MTTKSRSYGTAFFMLKYTNMILLDKKNTRFLTKIAEVCDVGGFELYLTLWHALKGEKIFPIISPYQVRSITPYTLISKFTISKGTLTPYVCEFHGLWYKKTIKALMDSKS